MSSVDNTKFQHLDKKRWRVICRSKECGFCISAKIMKDNITFEVVICNLRCECPQSHSIKCGTPDWIADEFIRALRNNPKSFEASVTNNANKYFG